MQILRPSIAVAAAAAVAGTAALVTPRASALTSSEAAFIKSIAPLAQESMRKDGVPASVTIAQAIVESGWGTSELARNANAFFGIKCKSGDNGPYALSTCYTKVSDEWIDGRTVPVSSPFRKYASKRNGVLDHGHFLRSRSWYSAAFKYTNDPDQFIREVHKGGYATDPEYANKTIERMRKYNLYQYDKIATTPTNPPTAPTTGSIVVDNATAGRFSASSNWVTSSYKSGRYGATYRAADPKPVSDAAWFKANLPRTQRYRVEVMHPADAGYSKAAPHVIETTTGAKTVMVDQTTGGGSWKSLGIHTLAAGDRHVVAVSRWSTASGMVVADAVRLTPVS